MIEPEEHCVQLVKGGSYYSSTVIGIFPDRKAAEDVAAGLVRAKDTVAVVIVPQSLRYGFTQLSVASW